MMRHGHQMVLVVLAPLCLMSQRVLAQDNRLSLLPGRDADPVVVRGTEVPELIGLAPDKIVGFRYTGYWKQIPVQIDERKYVDFGTVYNESPHGCGTMAYADSTTYVGADSDPAFDSDDELVFMARDMGQQVVWYAGIPDGVVATRIVEITDRDPLTDHLAYLYLFETDGSLTPDAGVDYVNYRFRLLSGSYLATYGLRQGPNPEDSYVYTTAYRTHFSDRFARDGLNILVGGATPVDILDRHRSITDTGGWERSEDTFDYDKGAFFTNKDGPVRAIRSYMGCNSGPRMQREHLFYEKRHDVTFYIRVHALGYGIMDLYDYSPDAAGMRYYDDLNLDGVLVDGEPDAIGIGPIKWQMVTGDQGTLVVVFSIESDMKDFVWHNHYSDDTSPNQTQCTGDAYEYGLSGFHSPSHLVNTDPATPPHKNLTIGRTVYYEGPWQTPAIGGARYAQSTTPLDVNVRVTAEPTRIEASPLAHWRLDEVEGTLVQDDGPYFAYLHGDPTWQPAGGRVGGALHFDGVDDYISTDPIINPAEGAFSVFCWVQGGGAAQIIVAQTDDDEGGVGAVWLGCDAAGHLLTTLSSTGRKTTGPLVSTHILSSQAWHHVGLVWDGSRRYLFVDGIECANDSTGASNVTGAWSSLCFGVAKTLQVGTFWRGLIDDVLIYDCAVKP